MSASEQADRNARNVLELVQPRRQLDAVRALLEALQRQPAPQVLGEVPA